MKTKFKHKGKEINLDVKLVSKFSSGLMFLSEDVKPRMFKFKKPVNFKITSLFVFFPFLAVWLDKENKVIDVREIKPFELSIEPSKKFSKLIEIPINQSNKEQMKLINFLVGD